MSMGTAPNDTALIATKKSATTDTRIRADLESEAGLAYIKGVNRVVAARARRG